MEAEEFRFLLFLFNFAAHCLTPFHRFVSIKSTILKIVYDTTTCPEVAWPILYPVVLFPVLCDSFFSTCAKLFQNRKKIPIELLNTILFCSLVFPENALQLRIDFAIRTTLIPVVVWFEGTGLVEAHVARLIIGQFR